MQDHRRLDVYRIAGDLAVQVYAVAWALPGYERYDLGRQLRRAAVSIGSNIGEGCGRSTPADFCSFLDRALWSAIELEFQLGLCQRVSLAPAELVIAALETTKRVQQMLTRLLVRIRRQR